MRQRGLHLLLLSIGLLACLALVASFVVWIDPWLSMEYPWASLGLNALPVLLLFLLLLAVFGRPSPALLVTFAATAAVFYLNHLKWTELNQPLLLTDFFLIGQVIGHLDLLADYTDLPLLITSSTIACLGFFVLMRTEPAWLSRPGQVLLGCLAVSGLLVITQSPGAHWYQNHIGPKRPWAPIQAIEDHGWMAAALEALHTEIVALPDPDPASLQGLWSQFEPSTSSSLPNPRPDVIVILSESFFEPRYLKSAELCVLLPRWCVLLEEGVYGEMRAPTFGGNTTRTEYEVLTGIPYAHLPQGIYPYTSVVLQPSASIAWWLKSMGYQTTAIHPHDRHFWQRHRALPLLGFDQFIAEQNFGSHRRSGFWISDADLTAKIIQVLDQGKDSPQFVFGISMENHGPWHGKRPNMDETRRAALPSIDGLDARADHGFRNYLYHQRQAVAALDELWQTVKRRKQPTVLLFFGDHLPGLHETFRQAGITNDFTPLTYPVPFLALTNASMNLPSWQPKESHQLGVWLLQLANLPLPSDYELLGQQYGQASIENDWPSTLYPHLRTLNPWEWFTESCTRWALCTPQPN